jgi:hypothetical protein
MSKKIIAFTTITSISLFTLYQTNKAYQISTTPSPFAKAANELGFNTPKKQEAFLKISYSAGYLKSENLWQDMCRVKIKDPETKFKYAVGALKKAGADQDDPAKFDPKLLRKALFRGSDIDEKDVMDLMLYMEQHAFNRKAGQERNELTKQSWMEGYKEYYTTAAKNLDLIDRIKPQKKSYVEAWIAGASRVGVLARIIDLEYAITQNKIQVPYKYTLAGGRELWANLDGIHPTYLEAIIKARNTDIDKLDISIPVGEDDKRTEEGKAYLFELAKKNNIALDSETPFTEYQSKEECPAGRFPNRVYPNYVNKDGPKLTESLMAADLMQTFFPEQASSMEIVDTAAEPNSRPTTASTARDAAANLVAKILSGQYGDQKHFDILFESNNPYSERQTLVAQREVDEALRKNGLDKQGYTITVEGVGFSCKQDVATVHSEFGALVAEKWKRAVDDCKLRGIEHDRDIKELLFQTKQNDIEVPDMPEFDSVPTLGIVQPFVDLFDYFL